jgi:hypothetical protein
MVTRRNLQAASLPILLVILGAIIVWLAPDERTLGDGIKSVYVHASLIIGGRIGLTVTGILGAVVLFTGRERLQAWAYRIGWVAWALFFAGVISSMVSATLTWGGVFLGEPRMRTSTQIVALGLIVQILNMWLPNVRWRGFLHLFLAGIMTWTIMVTELVLHPRNPVGTSTATGIQMTFTVLTLMVLAGGAWVIWHVRPRQPAALG